MVFAEEAFEDFRVEGEAAEPADAAQWQPSKAILVRDAAVAGTDWLGLLLGLFGRRTSARPPALTAEA
ncbi:MAG TPA: hypothetical protein VFY92_09510 [Hyphomicrobiaceae bacterium]|nr:hypothetical protein [Hyphomicrobiaceae bacterium]